MREVAGFNQTEGIVKLYDCCKFDYNYNLYNDNGDYKTSNVIEVINGNGENSLNTLYGILHTDFYQTKITPVILPAYTYDYTIYVDIDDGEGGTYRDLETTQKNCAAVENQKLWLPTESDVKTYFGNGSNTLSNSTCYQFGTTTESSWMTREIYDFNEDRGGDALMCIISDNGAFSSCDISAENGVRPCFQITIN